MRTPLPGSPGPERGIDRHDPAYQGNGLQVGAIEVAAPDVVARHLTGKRSVRLVGISATCSAVPNSDRERLFPLASNS